MGQIKQFVRIDVKNEITYDQRIALNHAMELRSEREKMDAIFEALHDRKPEVSEYITLIDYFEEILLGIEYWINAENEMLSCEPTIAEERAGIKEYHEKVKDFGTIVSLSKSFSCDPDIILGWKYTKVFGILVADLESYKFNQRYKKVINE